MNDPLNGYTLAEIREALGMAADLTQRIKDLEDDEWLGGKSLWHSGESKREKMKDGRVRVRFDA